MSTRNPFDVPHVASRRGGPVKQPLSRDAIVAEALRQITSDGVKGMSLRKVATALETGPASLYAYIADVTELHALVLDHALAAVDLCEGRDLGWRACLHQVLASYAAVLGRGPGLAQLSFTTIAVGPNSMRFVNRLLGLLEEGGVDLATRAWAVDLFMVYVTGIAAEKGREIDPAAPDGPVASALAAVSESEYPHLHAAREDLISGSPGGRFSWALEVLLSGILKVPPPPP